MDNIIIGTAGHIDHGKTTLIKALTGRDTDRLKEEQKRGISIELGFTYFDLPDGRRAGIIDVPGHERFIKNMLAGVGGIDLVLLVIAADEGIMPQTVEHMHILDLIRVKNGIIVLTKVDTVDKEWLEMVTDEIKEKMRDTFLEGAPIIPVSSTTGTGIDNLIGNIVAKTAGIGTKNHDTLYRLNIDRVFTITGFGTIVTGTLLSGKIEEGQRVCIYPAGIEARVRNLQVHDRDVDTAYAGQRLAINAAGIKKGQIQRGDVIAPFDVLQPTMMLDCRLRLIGDTDWVLVNRDRVRLHIGTKEVLCRVLLLDREKLNPDEECYAQLRLEEETVALREDRFIIRSYSPMETIGGGVVLEPNPPKRKRYDRNSIDELKLKEEGSPLQVLEKVISLNSSLFPNEVQLMKLIGKNAQEFGPMLEELIRRGSIKEFLRGNQRVYVHSEYYSRLLREANTILKGFHDRYPLRSGMPIEEFRNRLFGNKKGGFIDEIIRNMGEEGKINIMPQGVSVVGFTIELTGTHDSIMDYILERLKEGGYGPPGTDELLKGTPYGAGEVREVLDMLIETGQVKRAGEDTVFLKEYYDDAVNAVKDHIKKNGVINLATLRDCLGTSRKFAMALLEEMDRDKITKRTGDDRTLYR